MFGNNTFWWAGLLVFLFFVGLNVMIVSLRRKPRISYTIAYVIAAYLLVYKIGEYVYWQAIGEHMRFPVEFSAIGYFLVGIFITLKLKKVDGFAVFVGILAGMFYSISFWVSPDSHIETRDSVFLLVMAIINHHLLYTSSMLMLLNVRKFNVKDIWQFYLGAGIMVGYSWIIYLFTPYAEVVGKPMIIQITDGSVLSFLFHSDAPSGGILAAYYIVAILLFSGIAVGFYALNNACAKKRIKAGLPEDTELRIKK